MSYVLVGTNDRDRAAAFFDKVLAPLGCKRVIEFPGTVAYGKALPEFWVQKPLMALKRKQPMSRM